MKAEQAKCIDAVVEAAMNHARSCSVWHPNNTALCGSDCSQWLLCAAMHAWIAAGCPRVVAAEVPCAKACSRCGGEMETISMCHGCGSVGKGP